MRKSGLLPTWSQQDESQLPMWSSRSQHDDRQYGDSGGQDKEWRQSAHVPTKPVPSGHVMIAPVSCRAGQIM